MFRLTHSTTTIRSLNISALIRLSPIELKKYILNYKQQHNVIHPQALKTLASKTLYAKHQKNNAFLLLCDLYKNYKNKSEIEKHLTEKTIYDIQQALIHTSLKKSLTNLPQLLFNELKANHSFRQTIQSSKSTRHLILTDLALLSLASTIGSRPVYLAAAQMTASILCDYLLGHQEKGYPKPAAQIALTTSIGMLTGTTYSYLILGVAQILISEGLTTSLRHAQITHKHPTATAFVYDVLTTATTISIAHFLPNSTDITPQTGAPLIAKSKVD